MDEDGHAICQAIFKGMEGEEWERLCYMHVEMLKAVNIRQPSTRPLEAKRSKGEWRSILRSGK